jgi:hypothetical protein
LTRFQVGLVTAANIGKYFKLILGMIDEIKKLLIERYCLTKVIHTKHNNIYEGEGLVLIESTLTGMLKLKPKRR